jgi:hypothetical protein
VLKTTFLLSLALCLSAGAAPLFPRTDETHWAGEALRTLSERGLIAGYRDGTFKGDRAATRYEVAMILARLLQDEPQFASRPDVALLARELREELGTLGVRLTPLEESADRLAGRVSELERITFYGSFESRITAQTMRSQGVAGVPFLDYNQAVGGSVGPTLRPQLHGVIPVVDYRNGRALVNGVGFTALARFGLRAKIDADSEAGVEFAGFTSQGNTNIDAYWGVSAPYAANPWTLNQVAGGNLQGQNNAPFSRVVFDHAWYEHKPSKTRLTLGAFDTLRMDRFVYAGQSNNNAFGPARFPGFGFQLLGQADLAPGHELNYELFGSRFGDGGNVYQGTNYTHAVLGADLGYRHGRGDVRLNWVRFYDESPGLHGPLTGLANITNVAFGNSPGWTQTQWVNPPGYFAGQVVAAGANQAGAFTPNLVDMRPIAAWNPLADNAIGITAGGGNFGPQSQNTYGISGRYWFPLAHDGKDRLTLTGEYGHSDYKSNRNSDYVSRGDMGRVEAAATLGGLNLSLQAIRVDPNYNGALFNASLLGIRFVRPYNFLGRFHLHDSGAYPHNREGLLLRGSYAWDEFLVGFRAGLHRQTQTSLYDVRVPGGALGPGIPTNDVIGFSPGFIDTIFPGLAHPALYGSRSGNSFDAALNPLENPRGYTGEYGLNFRYKLDEPRLTLDFAAEHNTFRRDSVLSPALGGSQNLVDLRTDYGLLGLSWGFTSDWTLRTGMEVVRARGHHDPGGLYNGYALATGQTNFVNVDSTQTIPFVGFDRQLSPTSSWSIDMRYYNTRDHLENAGGPAHPFSWSGPQVTTYYKLTF